jgi:hypothetical protein
VIGLDREACRAHAVELAVIATRREPGSPATYDHLDRCERCRRELQGMALASLAMERLADEAAAHSAGDIAIDPIAAAAATEDPTWLALRRRAGAARGPLFRWWGHLAGVIVGAGLAVALFAPMPVDQTRPLFESGPEHFVSNGRNIDDQRAEDAWLWANQQARKESSSVDIAIGSYDPSIFGEGPFETAPKASDPLGLVAR